MDIKKILQTLDKDTLCKMAKAQDVQELADLANTENLFAALDEKPSDEDFASLFEAFEPLRDADPLTDEMLEAVSGGIYRPDLRKTYA